MSVEIGAKSFFLVCRFLKRLAGEHVAALVASILPFVSGVCRISVPGWFGRDCRCPDGPNAWYQAIFSAHS